MGPKSRKLPSWFLNQADNIKGGKKFKNKFLHKKKKDVGDPIKRTIYCMSPEEFKKYADDLLRKMQCDDNEAENNSASETKMVKVEEEDVIESVDTKSNVIKECIHRNPQEDCKFCHITDDIDNSCSMIDKNEIIKRSKYVTCDITPSNKKIIRNSITNDKKSYRNSNSDDNTGFGDQKYEKELDLLKADPLTEKDRLSSMINSPLKDSNAPETKAVIIDTDQSSKSICLAEDTGPLSIQGKYVIEETQLCCATNFFEDTMCIERKKSRESFHEKSPNSVRNTKLDSIASYSSTADTLPIAKSCEGMNFSILDELM